MYIMITVALSHPRWSLCVSGCLQRLANGQSTSHINTAVSSYSYRPRVLHYTREGWPGQIPEDLRPYWEHRDELSIEQDCRVFAWSFWKSFDSEYLHYDHPRIRSGIRVVAEIDWMEPLWILPRAVRLARPSNMRTHASVGVANKTMQQVHLDFAGPFLGFMFLVLLSRQTWLRHCSIWLYA